MKTSDIDGILESQRESQPPDPDTLGRIARTITASLQPVRPLPPNWTLTGGLLLVCAVVAIAGAARAGFYGVEKMTAFERALIFSSLVFVGWSAASEFVHAKIPGSRVRLSSGALLAGACLLLFGDFALCFRNYRTEHFVSAGLVCLVTGLLHALPAGILSWFILRRGLAVNPMSAGLLAGTLAGVAGLTVLELHCPNFEAAHVLVWHTAVVPLAAAIGASVAWARDRR